jgi:WD40 repeat protein
MNKTISFVEEDSEQLGHLIVNQRFDQFEITQESGKLIKTFKTHTDDVNCIAQIEDFSKFITCSNDTTIKIWSTESGECLKTLTGHAHSVTSLMISNDQKHLISGAWDKTIKVWNIENDFECVQTLHQEDGVTSLCLLPDNILICGLYNGTITKWNMNDFSKIDSFKAHEDHDEHINDIKHVSSSQIASAGAGSRIKLWNLETNECLRLFTGHSWPVYCLEISFDKSKLYTSSHNRDLKVWDVSSGECLRTIKFRSTINCITFLSSNFLAVGLLRTEKNLKIIDLKSHEIVKSLETKSRYVTSLNFDSDKNVLFSNNQDPGELQMWQF